MPSMNQVRADYDSKSIVVYQAYPAAIALPALKAQAFVPPFSVTRMTWIKPSFLWLMERSNWGQKAGQEYILAVRITRSGWGEALAAGVLTSYVATAHQNTEAWREQFDKALVHVQWDPERSIRGADLGINSIQVGLSRHIIQRFVDEWVISIEDYTPLVRKVHGLLKNGQNDKARKMLPAESLLPVEAGVARRLNIKS